MDYPHETCLFFNHILRLGSFIYRPKLSPFEYNNGSEISLILDIVSIVPT